MPDGVTIIDKLDEPSMGESSFKGRLPPLGGSPVTPRRNAVQTASNCSLHVSVQVVAVRKTCQPVSSRV